MSQESEAPAAADLPAEAVPPGVDPGAYVQQMQGRAAPAEPVVQTPQSIIDARRPAHVPEKFWDGANGRVNTEALLKSYGELERLRGKPVEERAAPTPAAPEGPAQPEDSAKIAPAKAEAAAKGEPGQGAAEAPAPVTQAIDSLTAKFETGELGEADFTAAEAAGLPRAVIETYFAGLKALEAAAALSAHEAAGGKQAFDDARAWAAHNLPAGDLDYYNAAVSDPKTSRQAVEWLVAKHRGANPSEGAFVSDSAPAVSAGEVYTAQAQVTADMRSERYRTDPAFRAEVAAKLQRTRAAGSLNLSAAYHSRTR